MRRKGKQTGEYVRVAGSDDVREEALWRVRAGKRSLLLTRCEGVVLAIDAVCPHGAADLGEGTLHRHKLCCPDHGYCFDIRNGAILWPPDEFYRLKRYEVREEGGSVYVRLD